MSRITLTLAVLIVAVATPSRAQVFADLKSALVDYSKADIEPHKSCESLANFKSKETVQIHAAEVPVAAGACGSAPLGSR